MNISDEAVEAAARAVYGLQLDEEVREVTKARFRKALEAAAPHMLAEAWEEGRQAEEDTPPLHRTAPNPYRSQG